MRWLIATILVVPAVLGAQVSDSAARPPVRRSIRLCAGGDVTLGTNLDSAWARMAAQRLSALYSLSADPDSLVPQLKPFIGGADVLLVNVEGAIGAGYAEKKCGPKS